jgi:hypothetical protein
MSYNADMCPYLVVTSRPMAGASFEIFAGYTEIGSDQGAGIQLTMDGVSQRHAAIDSDGHHIVLSDLGSPGGTWVNGRKLTSGHRLRDGDQVRVGFATLRFLQAGASAADLAPEPGTGPGEVRRSIGARPGRQDANGHREFAGRDLRGDDHALRGGGFRALWGELLGGPNAGRGLALVGACVCLAGLVLFGSALFGDLGTDPFERKTLSGVPTVQTGFALFLGGGLLAVLGLSLAKNARKGTRERKRPGRRRRSSP